jgi:hypothetical protein
MRFFYGSWDDLHRLLRSLENNEAEGAWERRMNDDWNRNEWLIIKREIK